jgi:hypothetical protein
LPFIAFHYHRTAFHRQAVFTSRHQLHAIPLEIVVVHLNDFNQTITLCFGKEAGEGNRLPVRFIGSGADYYPAIGCEFTGR